MLAIFDIDGTICDTQKAEDDCYSKAILEVTGISLETLDWTQYQEPTSNGIVRALLVDDPNREEKENRIKNRFVELLREAVPTHPQDFTPIDGAVEFITELREKSEYSVAIATGGFDDEARFKLQCCGLDIDEFPYATSSDDPKRSRIIPLAAKRAGFLISSCIYFGDALWDIQVSRYLGIPLVGIGRKKAIFEENQMADHFRDFSDRKAILEILHRQKMKSNQPAHTTPAITPRSSGIETFEMPTR